MWLRNLIVSLVLLVSLPLLGREFPLCLYGVDNPADLKLIQKAGFTCIQTYQTDPEKLELLAQKAQKRGMQVVFSPKKITTPYIQRAKEWPILAWYLVDEPDVHKWSREKVIQAHNQTKQLFPQHLTTLVIGQGKTRVPYYDIPDAMMVDWYPVPHLQLTSFGDNVRYTQEGLAKTDMQDHPLWGVVQIFDWKNFKQYRPDNDRIGRFPTENEIRFMSYHGILNGATGLFYFIFTHQGKPLPQVAPMYWKRVKRVVHELAQFRKIIERGKIVENTLSLPKPLTAKVWQYKEHYYMVLLNTTPDEVDVPPQLLDKKYKMLFGKKKSISMPSYDVWLLQFK